jgi:hypothetical protein
MEIKYLLWFIPWQQAVLQDHTRIHQDDMAKYIFWNKKEFLSYIKNPQAFVDLMNTFP